MDLANLPLLHLDDDEPTRFAAAIGESFRTYGFAMLRGHGIDATLIETGWDLTRDLFALPEADKRRYHLAGCGGARGYTPFRTEIAKGASDHDLKEFWHIGRDLPAGHRLSGQMLPNVWPNELPSFRPIFTRLYAEFDRVGATILSRIALYLGLGSDWFEPAIAGGNSVLRLLRYPPIGERHGNAIRAGAHEDINLITLLLGAEEAGLELLGPDGRWIAIAPPEGALVVNVGDMLQRLTNHFLPSTTHRVRNPTGARARLSRYSMPFFLHPRSDFLIETLDSCISEERPQRYPVGISADKYLQERLLEIGLK